MDTQWVTSLSEQLLQVGLAFKMKYCFIHLTFGAKVYSTFAESIMEPFLKHLHTYVSVSGPHLGYLYCSNPLFNSGLWLLKTLKGTQCIYQLTLTDDSDIQNTFLYKLCKVGGPMKVRV